MAIEPVTDGLEDLQELAAWEVGPVENEGGVVLGQAAERLERAAEDVDFAVLEEI